MGKVIARKINGMNLWAKVALTVLFTFATTVFMYEGWYKPKNIQAAITNPGAWTKAYDQVSGTGTGFNYTVATGNTNRILVVAITHSVTGSATQADPTTITYGGTTLTKATDNGTTSGRMHTWLYYLKDTPSVMDGTARPLNVTLGGTHANMTVWAAVFAGVDQSAAITTGSGLNNTSGSGPAQLSAAMAVNTGQQAVYIANVYNATNTTIPTYTINANWTSGGTNTGSSGSIAWDVDVANRTIPGSNTTDNAATSTIAPASSIRYAMSAMSLPAAAGVTNPTVTAASPNNQTQGTGPTTVTITGSGFQSGAVVTFSGTGVTAGASTFVSSTQITVPVTVTAGATTGLRNITVTNPDTGTGTGNNLFTVNAAVVNPTVTSASPNNQTQGTGPTTVTINGTGFQSGATVTFSGTGVTAGASTFVSSTQITVPVTVTAGATTGLRNITVTNPDTGTGTGNNLFTVNASASCTANTPTLSVAPTSATVKTSQGTTYTVSVTNNDSGGSCGSVTFNLSKVDSNPSGNFTIGALSQSSLVLAAGATGTATFTVTATGAAVNGNQATSTISVTATGHTAPSNAVATTTVNNAGVVSNVMHNSTNTSTTYGTWGTDKDCSWCHSATNFGNNVKRIAQTITTPTGNRTVLFTRMTASTNTIQGNFGNDERQYALSGSTNVCEVCHHKTKYHQYSNSKIALKNNPAHPNNRKDCTGCHDHAKGFSASCDGCHPATGGLATSPAVTGATGGAAGAHTKHTGAPYNMVCATCHNAYTANPMGNNQIELSFQVNATNFSQFNPSASVAFGTFSGLTPLSNGYTWVGKNGTTIATSGNTNASCNVYCHGNWPNSRTTADPSWKGAALTCGSCHFTSTNVPAGAGDHSVHLGLTGSLALTCANCHPSSAYTNGHLSGSVNWALSGSKINTNSKYKNALSGATTTLAPSSSYGACATTSCHGMLSPTWGGAVGTTGQCQKCHGSQSVAFATVTSAQVAPGTGNIDTGRVTGTTVRGGMHQEHLKGTANISEPVKCTECHVKVTAITDAAHMNFSTATITFGGTARAASHNPTISRVGGAIRCDNTYCHTANRQPGAAAGQSGINNPPTWNDTALIGGTTLADTCISKCHALPPGSGVSGDTHQSYAAVTTFAGLATCSSNSPATGCHPTIQGTGTSITSIATIWLNAAAKLLHIDGKVDGGSCVGCHGKSYIRTKGRAGATLAQITGTGGEFGLAWGHKKSGRATVTDADCIVCHLEGDASTGKPSATYHQDGNIDLRDPDGVGEAPITNISGGAFTFQRFSTSYAAGSRTSTGHTSNTDIANVITQKFCLACHDSNGATNTTARSNNGGTGTAAMPFGGIALGAAYIAGNGAIGTQGLIDVKTATATTNASAHPVQGPRNRAYPITTFFKAPYNNFTRTAGTKSNGVVINCFDCHNTPTLRTTRTIVAHGNAVTLRGNIWANPASLCTACHNPNVGSPTDGRHGTGSALNSGTNSGMQTYITTQCHYCHSSNTATPGRPIRAQDVHGFDAFASTVTGGDTMWPVGATNTYKPYAFFRNRVNWTTTSWKPASGLNVPTGSATCGGTSTASSGCTGENMGTYTPGGAY